MRVTVKMLTGHPISVADLDPEASVRELKGRIYELDGCEPDSQRVASADTKTGLVDTAILKECGIADGSTLLLLLAVKAVEEAAPDKAAAAVDWRTDLSPDQLHQCMLERHLAADVLIEVKDTGGRWVSVMAHRYMLTLASSAFETLCALLPGRPFIRVKFDDIARDHLWQLLRFIYIGVVELSTDNVIPVLHAAMKLKVQGLVVRCKDELERKLQESTPGEVLVLFDTAVVSDQTQLAKELTARISSSIQTSKDLPEFTRLSTEALARLLRLDNLSIAENALYDACRTWARAKCEEADREITDASIRETLGELLYLIRFPMMTPAEFGAAVTGSNILSPEEKVSVFEYFTTKKAEHTRFPTEHRQIQKILNRFQCLGTRTDQWHHKGNPDAICFIPDQAIVLTSVCLYSAREAGKRCQVRIEILEGYKIPLAKKTVQVLSEKDATIQNIALEPPVALRARQKYTLRTTAKTKAPTWYGDQGSDLVETGGVRFKFSLFPANDTNGTGVTAGQIPGFLFMT